MLEIVLPSLGNQFTLEKLSRGMQIVLNVNESTEHRHARALRKNSETKRFFLFQRSFLTKTTVINK